MSDVDQMQIRRYIAAAEYGLALDDMADIVLELNQPVASDLRHLFDAAADKMDIKPGDGWTGVESLRALPITE